MSKKSANEVIDRLQIALCLNSDSQLCRMLNVSRSTLGTWRQRNSVPYSFCINIAEEKNISLDWLLTGEGEMLKNSGRKEIKEDEVVVKIKALQIAELIDSLNQQQQNEIFSVIAEKKRVNELENFVREIQQERRRTA